MVHGHVPRSIETVVVGAGQAGLAMSWYLSRGGREHVLLDRRELGGGGWRDRWDSFCLVTPNWASSLPGYPYDGDDPDGFMGRDEIAARIACYADAIDAPVILGTTVEHVSATEGSGAPDGGRFRLQTSGGPITARDVVIATGGFHTPRIPSVAASLPRNLTQIHTHHYRREEALPPGAVLIVGSGQSGVQIAEELHDLGRRVYLSIGSTGRLPRRYRGRDIFGWIGEIQKHGAKYDIALPTVDKLPDQRLRFTANPHLSGHGGGHDMDLRRMAADGITLLGHLDAVDGATLRLRPDLAAGLSCADRYFDERFRPLIDPYIERAGIDAPPDDRRPFEFEPAEQPTVNLADAGISTVIWACGYGLDFGWLDLPILDENGTPRQTRGVTEIPGLYFLGLPWQHTMISSTLVGLGADAQHLAAHMGLVRSTAGDSAPA
jgi:putative flavoprotein involved in K+ transport